VQAAAARIDGYAHRTPVLTSRTANAELGAEVFSNAKTCSAWALSNSAAPTMRWRVSMEAQRRAGVVAFLPAITRRRLRCRPA
jgi:threonine dehydratase